jgi:hypothetical protein
MTGSSWPLSDLLRLILPLRRLIDLLSQYCDLISLADRVSTASLYRSSVLVLRVLDQVLLRLLEARWSLLLRTRVRRRRGVLVAGQNQVFRGQRLGMGGSDPVSLLSL